MQEKYTEYKGLNLPELANQLLEEWENAHLFEQSIQQREGKTPFIFFEGPPSANGMPGIHHVMARAIKDIFCRYKTLKGFQVKRKAGWDTHGLPVELGVEKELGITKEDIGKKISIEEYNKACREAVMRYTDVWNDLTRKMGYWVDMENPYVTYTSKYMETVWWLLAQMYRKNLLYKGYTIQPYSPKAGTGLSSHELNQPGCYKDVTDTTVVAQFRIPDGVLTPFGPSNHYYFLAWTTTPWTLPSNTALCVGPSISYVLVHTFNPYTREEIKVILAENLLSLHFGKGFKAAESLEQLSEQKNDKEIPFLVLGKCQGKELVGISYEQLLPFALPAEHPEKAFRVISGDFVTTEDGTGIVHIAPTFGSDDAKVAADANVPAMLVEDEQGNLVPLVDLQGKFRPEMGELAGMFVKNEYYDEGEAPEKSVDVLLSIQLKMLNKAFKVEKYVHSYPHCWRTDKPVLYYPLDSWFIKVTEVKERMQRLNDTIHWKPESTGSGRFGKWLENANDWNLSRSRYWGIPIPIWSTEDGTERLCIGSVEELKHACEASVNAGFMERNPLGHFTANDFSAANYDAIDLHKNEVDRMVLVSPSGKPMKREADLIDVWFDSGAMPYAQWHYPFENKELIDGHQAFPADFIAEGVDQTRGWFYTLHAIATMVFDSVAYKNVISNGLVLDKNGQKMSKRLGNAVDPFETIDQYGPDATRWYMITNAQPWDNLKFDAAGIAEVQRKFFGTLYNTYSFFALYANLDGFDGLAGEIPISERPEIDRWVLSKLNSLIKDVDEAYHSYEPTKAGRLLQAFVGDELSNWYVRLCRRRYWKSDDLKDKTSAYQTLYTCLETVALLGSPIAPFYMDRLFRDLNKVTRKHAVSSVHLADFPSVNNAYIDPKLENQMELAQRCCSLVLSLRKKEHLRVRQPLQKIMIPALNDTFADHIMHVKDLILSEVNVKELELLPEGSDRLVKRIKPNFKTIGPKYGKHMKSIASIVAAFTAPDIQRIEQEQQWSGMVGEETIRLDLADFEIVAQDIPGWLVASEGNVTVALDITVSDVLRKEGIAREVVNRVQNARKDTGLDVTDRISIRIDTNEGIQQAIKTHEAYICAEVLANEISFVPLHETGMGTDILEANDTRIELQVI
jgi:isoleucyl-tRNA synthetase